MIFAFHAHPWQIHRLTYRRTTHRNIRVRGDKEACTITAHFDVAEIRNWQWPLCDE